MTTRIEVQPNGHVTIIVEEQETLRGYAMTAMADECGPEEARDMVEVEPPWRQGLDGPALYGPHNQPPLTEADPRLAPREGEAEKAVEEAQLIYQRRVLAQNGLEGISETSRILMLAGCRGIHMSFWDNSLTKLKVLYDWAKRVIGGEVVPYPELLSIGGIYKPKPFDEVEGALDEVAWLRRLSFDAQEGDGGRIYADVPAEHVAQELQRLSGLLVERGWRDDAGVSANLVPSATEDLIETARLLWVVGKKKLDPSDGTFRNRVRPPARESDEPEARAHDGAQDDEEKS